MSENNHIATRTIERTVKFNYRPEVLNILRLQTPENCLDISPDPIRQTIEIIVIRTVTRRYQYDIKDVEHLLFLYIVKERAIEEHSNLAASFRR